MPLRIAGIVLALTLAFAACFVGLSRTAAGMQRLSVVIDAGHGGVDGGVVGTESGVKESDINLALSRILQEKFEEAGFHVVMTRQTESGLYGMATPGYKKRDMQRRAEIISESAPSLVISVHQNFFSARSRRGAQVFFREDLPASVTLAGSVQTALNALPQCVRQYKPLKGDYFILNCSNYPAVIVECGFLSNAEDEQLLLDRDYREALSDAIFEGAVSYLAAAAEG